MIDLLLILCVWATYYVVVVFLDNDLKELNVAQRIIAAFILMSMSVTLCEIIFVISTKLWSLV